MKAILIILILLVSGCTVAPIDDGDTCPNYAYEFKDHIQTISFKSGEHFSAVLLAEPTDRCGGIENFTFEILRASSNEFKCYKNCTEKEDCILREDICFTDKINCVYNNSKRIYNNCSEEVKLKVRLKYKKIG